MKKSIQKARKAAGSYTVSCPGRQYAVCRSGGGSSIEKEGKGQIK